MPATTLTERALIRLSGEDVRGFLNGLVTQDVSGALPVWAGLLTPQGKCLFDFLVWEDGDDLLIDCDRDCAGDLAKRLTLYRLRRPIRIEREPTLCVHWSADGEEGIEDPRLASLGRRWMAPWGGDDGADDAWRAHRLSHGVCEGRAELGDILWLECNAAELNGVSFTKGCFIGQENTARMNWRSKVNRRLVVVDAAESGPRTRAHYPDLGLAVEHRRVDDLTGVRIPEWLEASLIPAASE
ncbi:folate-binding protein YgfZ [Sphingomonas lutea]|uniref:Folate-binding protein YgfZ n=1 Tax=Sphingomonas lutea TaxID=1045317 RepID=A0A7G9SIV3_9SPHN|nr:folate-binding protein YgfZ [Sphingomonas lutea]QNN67778.1 folate-binding protein YgfZ [Sphingomonas lutea]